MNRETHMERKRLGLYKQSITFQNQQEISNEMMYSAHMWNSPLAFTILVIAQIAS